MRDFDSLVKGRLIFKVVDMDTTRGEICIVLHRETVNGEKFGEDSGPVWIGKNTATFELAEPVFFTTKYLSG